MELLMQKVSTAVGELTVVTDGSAIVAVLWEREKENRVRLAPLTPGEHPLLTLAALELREYFEGQREDFSLPLRPMGTAFQQEVWTALQEIPFAETRSYRDLAIKIGRPKAARAVGAANSRNPISIMIPCHRVVGLRGELTGFAGGLEAKARLLALERREAMSL